MKMACRQLGQAHFFVFLYSFQWMSPFKQKAPNPARMIVPTSFWRRGMISEPPKHRVSCHPSNIILHPRDMFFGFFFGIRSAPSRHSRKRFRKSISPPINAKCMSTEKYCGSTALASGQRKRWEYAFANVSAARSSSCHPQITGEKIRYS